MLFITSAVATVQAGDAPPDPKDTDDIGLMPGVPLAPHDVDTSSKIGVIDSGVRREHPQIGNSVGLVRDFTGEGLDDHYGHGTKVVLVLLYADYENAPALKKAGITPKVAEIEVAKVIGKKSASAQIVADRIADAVLWLASLKVRIVNISISLPNGKADYRRLCATLEKQEGMIFTIAAGNSGLSSVVYPAACPIHNKMVVGAARDGKVEPYSGPSDLVAELPPAAVSPARYWLLQGDSFYREDDHARAKQAYESGLQSHPDPQIKARLEYNLGFLALKANDDGAAAERFMAAAQAMPSLDEPYLALAVMNIRGQKFEAARSFLEQGVSAGADSTELHTRLATVYLDLDRPHDALEQLDELRGRGIESKDLESFRRNADNMIVIENWVAKGQSPLVIAASLTQADAGQLLRFVIRRWHPDLDAVPPGSHAPLLVVAVTKGQGAIVDLLIASGAGIDAHDPQHNVTALMMAAEKGNEKICGVLLARGANIDLRDDFGFSPLMFAAEAGHSPIVKLLLGRGANVAFKSKDGLDASDYARKHGHQDIVKMIADAQRPR